MTGRKFKFEYRSKMVEINQTPHVVGGKIGASHYSSAPSDIYYEKKLKEIFMMAADNSEGIIYSEQGWNYFIALMLKTRLAGVRDTERLETVKPSFPLVFETFVNTV